LFSVFTLFSLTFSLYCIFFISYNFFFLLFVFSLVHFIVFWTLIFSFYYYTMHYKRGIKIYMMDNLHCSSFSFLWLINKITPPTRYIIMHEDGVIMVS